MMSAHFNNALIEGNVAAEYSDLIDVVFAQDACAEFLCTKLYRYFVNYDLTTDVKTNVIPIMKQTMLTNNYDVMPVMEQLLKSEHFYDVALRGCQIKSPIETMFTLMNSSMSSPNYSLDINYRLYLSLFYATSVQGQNVGAPPNVGGWPAYYQSPSFSKLWLNSTYLKLRFDYAAYLTIYGGFDADGNKYKVDALKLVDSLSFSNDAPSVIDDMCDLYFSKDVGATNKTTLKSILTNGLPDFEWINSVQRLSSKSGGYDL